MSGIKSGVSKGRKRNKNKVKRKTKKKIRTKRNASETMRDLILKQDESNQRLPTSPAVSEWQKAIKEAIDSFKNNSGLTTQEIADILGIATCTARSRIRWLIGNNIVRPVPSGGVTKGINGMMQRVTTYVLVKGKK